MKRRWGCLVAGLTLGLALLAAPAYARTTKAWVGLSHPVQFNAGAAFLLTDGQVLVQDQGPKNSGSNRWWILTPSAHGSYRDGTWKHAASLPSDYGPISYASAVLPDGRFVMEGGEDNLGNDSAYSNQGEIYNPVENSWTNVAPPDAGAGEWSRIGDAPGAVLADGDFMVGASGYSGTTVQAILNEQTLTWTSTGTGKADGNDEEGWSLLPDGDLLTVDTQDIPNSELYDPATGSWHSAGPLPESIVDHTGEIGPQLLMPDGVVFAAGGNGDNALYLTSKGSWLAGPSFPVINGKQFDVADGPAAALPDGNVLLVASPGDYHTPAHFFLTNGGSLKRTTDAPGSAHASSYDGYMLVLPTGEILFSSGFGTIYLYEAGGRAKQAWRPSVSAVPTRLAAGATYSLSGEQLNGLTQGAAYGDDYQDATNYPLVRITNNASGRVSYARTFGFSNMSIAPGNLSSTKFTLPRSIRNGKSKLVVVANGIASPPVTVKIRGGRN